MSLDALLEHLGPPIDDPEEGEESVVPAIRLDLKTHARTHTHTSLVHAQPNTFSESFLLFSRDIPSQDLGFVDAKAASLELTVAGHDLTIHQSPTVLSSNRAGGTTGAG